MIIHNTHTTIDKLLKANPIEWEKVSTEIINLQNDKNNDKDNNNSNGRNGTNRKHIVSSTSASISTLLLLSIVKKDDVPVNVVRLLTQSKSTKLKTLRNAFDCACMNKNVGAGVKELLLDEITTHSSSSSSSSSSLSSCSPSLVETLLLTAIKSNCEETIDAIMERHVNFLSPRFYYDTFHEDDMFERLCDILIERLRLHLHQLPLTLVHGKGKQQQQQQQQLQQQQNAGVHKDLIFNAQILHAAAYRGHQELTRMIMNQFPGTLTQKDTSGDLPLHCACESGELGIARVLLRKGMDIGIERKSNQNRNRNHIRNSNSNPSKSSGSVGHCHLGGLLAKNKSGKSALRIAIGSGADPNKVLEALEWINDVDPTLLCDERVLKDVDLLHLIARHGICTSILKTIIGECPCPCPCPSYTQWKDSFGNTALEIACENGNFETAKHLHCSAMAMDVQKFKQKHHEQKRKRRSCNKRLLEAIASALEVGIDPDCATIFALDKEVELTGIEDISLLHHVASRGSVPCARMLLDSCRTCLHSKDSAGALPIHWACREHNDTMIEFLLNASSFEYGGMLTLNDEGVAPLQYLLDAYADDDPDTDLLLISQCISACLRAVPDLPLIHFAIAPGKDFDVEIIQELVDNFDLNITNTWRNGKTALIHVIDAFAKDPQRTELMKLFQLLLSKDINENDQRCDCVTIKDNEGRLPLHYALELQLRWENIIKELVDASFYSLSISDGKTGLLPFMLSAIGSRSDLNTIFHLLRSDPSL